MAAIERAAGAEPWAGAFLSGALPKKEPKVLLAAPSPGGAPVACLGYWISHDEAHVVNLATHPDHRRRGFAKGLLEHLIESVSEDGIRYVILEVRRSNRGAIELYQRAGFEMVGARPLYYTDDEDALVMILQIRSNRPEAIER
jgi:ribosomal-protein-alanine N-acetyltransferase